MAVIALQHQKQSDLLANADLFVDWEIVKGLKLNLTGSAQLGGGYDDNYSEPNNLGRSPSKDSYTKALNNEEQYTFTASLTDTDEDRVGFHSLVAIVDQLFDQHCFTNSGTTEKSHLETFLHRCEEIQHLDTSPEDIAVDVDM